MSIINWVRVVALAVLVAACGGNEAASVPAPIGDKAALEKLAASYEAIMERLPGSPWMLTPEDRKRFVEQVFTDSGYQYRATLLRMAEGKWDPKDKNARDLTELLFMPHTNLSPGQPFDGVYSEEEWTAVRKVQEMLR